MMRDTRIKNLIKCSDRLIIGGSIDLWLQTWQTGQCRGKDARMVGGTREHWRAEWPIWPQIWHMLR